MSINISSKLVRHSSSIVAVIDTKTFGPKQQSSYTRMCRSGVMFVDSVPAIAARHFRRSQRLGSALIIKRRCKVMWNKVTDNDFFDRLIAGIVAAKLTHVDGNTWVNGYLDVSMERASARIKTGECYIPASMNMKLLFNNFSLEVYSGLIPTEVSVDILNRDPL